MMCEKTFTDKQNTRRHVKTLHVHSCTEIALRCDICQKSFAKLTSFDDQHSIAKHLFNYVRTDSRGGNHFDLKHV